MTTTSRAVLAAGVYIAFSLTHTNAAMAATACEALAKIRVSNVTIVGAATVTEPSTIADTLAQSPPAAPLCRVDGYIAPTRDSHIAFEVWLPSADTWNHKLAAVGNGGLSGALNLRAMVPIFNRGYATMTTDLGHTNNPPNAGEDATWALGHPEKIIDYSYRAEHVTTLAAKKIVDAFYGKPPAHSYYTGCSAGGIQGMTEVLRYPKDFDGYVIGDATPDHLGQEIAAMWNTLAASLADSTNALKAPQITLVHQEILAQCVGKDGGSSSDPFLTNPLACSFDPKKLQCTDGRDASTCLTPTQVAIFEKIYQGPTNPRNHEALFSGLTPGTELMWDRYFVGKKNPVGPDRPWAGFMTDMVYSDPDYLTQQKYLSFDFDKDYTAVRARKVASETLDESWNTRNRDLEDFRKSGGKIIHYHGWDDPNIPSMEAVKFFREVMADQATRHHMSAVEALAATQMFYRLFMVQGMGHCGGGSGPSNFGQNGQHPLKAEPEYDTLIALENWVEQGKAPLQFIGSRQDKAGAVDMTRPICVYPKDPVWNGSGNVNDAGSFVCKRSPGSSAMNRFVAMNLAAALAALAVVPPSAQAQNESHTSLAGMYYLNNERGPMRAVDLTPPTANVSNQILAGPSSGLDSAYIIYSRIAAGVKPKDLYTLPVDHTYLVLSGKLNVQLGSDQFVAGPETLVLVPAGVPHRVWNAGTEPEADFQVITPAPSRDLASMMKKASARPVDNAAQYIRVAPPLEELKGGTGHDSLNERVLASRATGSEHVLERLNDVPPGGGRTEAHIHPFDQLYFVREGTLTFQYGMNTYDVGANTLVVLPAGVVHSNTNKGTTVQRLITLLISEPTKGSPMGAGVTLESQRAAPSSP